MSSKVTAPVTTFWPANFISAALFEIDFREARASKDAADQLKPSYNHIIYYNRDMSITALYEQGASKERIGLTIKRWHAWCVAGLEIKHV